MIAESAGKQEEIMDLPEDFSAENLKDQQVEKYGLKDPEAVQLAVNQQLNQDIKLKEGDEIAFLPPFAGG